MQDHLDRLDALLETGRSAEHLTRDTRRAQKAGPAGQRWLDDHRDDLG